MTTRNVILLRQAILASLIVGVVGCAVGPDFHRPAPPEAKSYQSEPTSVPQADAQRLVETMDVPGQWWTLFHSVALNDLIVSALKANPDIAAAQAALRIAQENVYAQEGAYFPSVSANLNPTRQKTAGSLSAVPSSGAYIYSLHTAQLNISYAPDVFGGNRRQVESLKAQAEAQRYQLEATRLTLTSNLVNAAIQEASLRAQIEATQAIIADQQHTLESFRTQFTLGQVAEADVATQQAALAQAQASLPPLQKQLVIQRDAIKALAGRFPDQEPDARFVLADLQLPAELPLSLPSKLVEQRPDVRAAEAQLHSASAQIGVAVANRLPNFSIDGSIGSSANKFGDLFKAGTGFWSTAGNLTQPIFEGSTLLHRQRAAEAAFDQASAQYQSTVIGAFQNVADALHAVQIDTDAWKAALASECAAKHSLDIARNLLKLGSISILSMLQAEQTWQQARLMLIQAEANRLADSAALLQALGGGWWNRTDATASTTPMNRDQGSMP